MRELGLRVATPDDAEVFADLETAAHPDEPTDPVVTRQVLAGRFSEWDVTHLLVCSGDRAVGVAWVAHAPRRADEAWSTVVEGGLAQTELTPDRLAATFDLLEERALAERPTRLFADCMAHDAAMVAELGRRGYRLDREERIWELDLVERREHVLARRERSRTAMARLGVRMATMDECPETERYEQYLPLMNRASRDVPGSVPYVDITVDQLQRRLSLPDRRLDRFWVAWRGGRMVGTSYLLFPPTRGNVWTGFTATDPDHRGLGIGRAVKMESLGQAAELGIPRVRTGNDTENAPMLHINETLGYRVVSARLTFVRA